MAAALLRLDDTREGGEGVLSDRDVSEQGAGAWDAPLELQHHVRDLSFS
jgi:hypothetical protein